jgi:membrane-bound metal-dependent hydrolase YbcI (DUF457 family)
VNTSSAPLPGTTPLENTESRAAVGLSLLPTYDADINIDVFSGPAFRFERHLDNIRVIFLPWHRRWTHSLPLATVIGLGVALLLGPAAGLVCGLAFATHVLQDQLGHMGSNLFWPFTRRRSVGLGLLNSGDPLPNFLTVWLAAALILFNLDRFSTTPRLPTLPYLLGAVLLPLLILSTSYWHARRRKGQTPPEPLRQAEILAETEEIEL